MIGPTLKQAERTRLMNRKDASRYLGICVKTFDRIRHLFAVDVAGNIRYDAHLMDGYIELRRISMSISRNQAA